MILRRPAKKTSEIGARITAVLVEVEPLLRMEHSRLELVEYSAESGVAVLAIAGECPDCAVSPATFSTAIEAHIRMRIPEVREVKIAG